MTAGSGCVRLCSMPSLERRLLGPARLMTAWFVLWAGFWAAFFVMIGLADPGSIDPGEPEAIARIFTWLGLASGVIFGLLANWAGLSGRTGEIGIVRSVLWGTLASCLPPLMLGKLNQILVLAPVGAAIGGALAFTGSRASLLRPGGGLWFAAARFISRGFTGGSA